MFPSEYNRFLPQEEVHRHFVLDGARLCRKLADGSVKQLVSMDGSRVVTLFNHQRLVGVDIAWCLIHGNWPIFPIAQLEPAAPHNFSPDNLFPARLRVLRRVFRQEKTLYYHNLSKHPFATIERRDASWVEHARDFYKQDLPYVLRLEAAERDLRAGYVADMRKVEEVVPLPVKTVRAKRPSHVRGREWHWNKGEWISVPEACHVADDYMVRIRRQRAGAVRHEFQPSYREVWGFDAAGAVVP